MNDSPAKRQRTEDTDAAAIPLVRSSEYWFDDGNIILQVESTQFRLHKSMLSLHSAVCRDMLTIPLPADEPTVEDCPVVALSDDTVQDWIYLLGAMYPNNYRAPMDIPYPAFIAAALRLSKKYDIPMFRKDCLRRLRKEFPTTLQEFDDLNCGTYIVGCDKDLLLLMSLAQEIGLPSVLPSIYCHVVTVLDAKDASLSATNRLACLLGHANLLELQSKTTMAWLDSDNAHIPCGICNNSVKCSKALDAIALKISKVHPRQIWVIDDWNSDWEEKGMCRPCLKKAKEVYNRGRELCWEQLPAAFGLPDWDELKSLDFE
ncbi:hypothetical protein DFH06DRAFT_1016718 [Mycena polygramma]|nr:hypothetical protein DFH06DRAFT_1016718 [Mycena polygramma]